MISFRKQISERLTTRVMDEIKSAPKPTKVAEVLAVVKQFPGIAITIEEVAEIANISDPGKPEKSSPSDYNLVEVGRHPDMRVLRTPNETLVKYLDNKAVYGAKSIR